MQEHYSNIRPTATTTPEGQNHRPRDPRVMMWAEETGPRLRPIHKAVLKFISEFADPDTGEGFPSQESIARATGYSRQAVSSACKELRDVGLLTWRHEEARSSQPNCKIYYNVYRLAGVDSGWAVVRGPDEPGALSPTARAFVTLFSKLQQSVDLLEEHGVDVSAIIEDEDIKNLAHRVKFEYFTRSGEDDFQDGPAEEEAFAGLDPPPPEPPRSNMERLNGLNELAQRLDEENSRPVLANCPHCGFYNPLVGTDRNGGLCCRDCDSRGV